MEFENDIFISCGILDNHPLVEGELGWVSNFHRCLKIRLSQLMGRKPKIWFDEKSSDNQQFTPELKSTIESSALFIVILSPNYLLSESTAAKIANFHTHVEKSPGLHVGNHSRIFKVVKTPIPYKTHPQLLKDKLGYDFFRIDQVTGQVEEYDKIFGKEMELAFWSRLNDLAYDIHDTLQAMECVALEKSSSRHGEGPDLGSHRVSAPPAPEKQNVYLAEATLDLRDQRESMKRELVDKGFKVLPDIMLPTDGPNLKKKVFQDVEMADFAIHLFGEDYGFIPVGAKHSVVEIQNRITSQKSRDLGLKRMIWIKPNMNLEDERQENFIHKVQKNPEFHALADIFETPFESFKTAVGKAVISDEPTVLTQSRADEKNSEMVYLICNQTDLDQTNDLKNYLFEKGFKVVLPSFEGEEHEIRQDHKMNLVDCDAAILFYGNANDLWVRAKLRDFRKIPAFGRTAPLLNKAVYLASPFDEAKNKLKTQEARIIKGSEIFDPRDVVELTRKIKAG